MTTDEQRCEGHPPNEPHHRCWQHAKFLVKFHEKAKGTKACAQHLAQVVTEVKDKHAPRARLSVLVRPIN